SFTGCSHELDLQTIGFIHLHNSAKVSAAETLLWEVRVKHYGIKNLVHHVISPGNAVTNSGTSAPKRLIQTVNTSADFPEGPFRVPRISCFWPYGLSCPSSALSETGEKRGLEAPDRVRSGKKIVPDLRRLNDCTFSCGQLHFLSRIRCVLCELLKMADTRRILGMEAIKSKFR
ncbi:MAG: hypothetical protein O7B35_03865, partial [Deltaproteobacteria bacterium]|nr:hypothetical protein [Deltaproteobacteria bacterium]